jgi:putative heme-binding domain-containing protein
LYRVRDSNGDDQLDNVERLKKIDGSGEHGPHAVLLHPDQKSLVIVCGNGTKPMEVSDSAVPKNWQFDNLIPRIPDGNGFMKDVPPPGGCIYKIDPEGKTWTLLSSGYRNEYDAAFNSWGDLFTYDADMEWDVNTPWYRPTRVCLASSGSEYGWRNGSGKWPPYYIDTLPPIVDIGPGSPTGVCFGYQARFPEKYQSAFFICDWSYGKLYAVHLKPHQSHYQATTEEFISGTPLPLTDVVINPLDGAMYFTIGGRKTTSALYRVTYTGQESTMAVAKAEPTVEWKMRKSLERFHTSHAKADEALAEAWPALGHPDRFIRYAARIALEHQPVQLWSERALNIQEPTAACTALTALARCGTKSVQPQLLAALNRIPWTPLTTAQRLDLLRVYQLAFTRMGKPSESVVRALVQKWDALYPTNDRLINSELCGLLVFLESPNVASKTLALISRAQTQEEEIDYIRSLRMLKSGWKMEEREALFKWFQRAASFKGGHSLAGFMKNIRNDAIETLTPKEKSKLSSLINAPLVASVPQFKPRPFVKKWTVEELAPALETGMTQRDFERGRRLFSEAKCFACHRFALEGSAVGPDLTGIAGRFNKRDLLESIIEPSKTISDQYGAVMLVLEDGRLITGRIVNHSGNSISVNTDMLNPDGNVSVDASLVEKIYPSKTSMMPTGLLDTMSQDEILDLTAFLLSRGDARNPMFRKEN